MGGYNPIEADDDDIKQLALFSLDSITQQTMSKRSLGLIRVISAKSQVYFIVPTYCIGKHYKK